MKVELMSPERLEASLAVIDYSDPVNGLHVINIVKGMILTALEAKYGAIVADEYRIDPRVTVEDNYDALLFPADNAGRSSRYTRYVTPDIVLRTHTSAAIPQWLRETDREVMDDIIVPIPGVCYRRDVVDKIHSAEPHQMDVWRIKKGSPGLVRADLIELIETVRDAVIPGYEYRANEVEHPYTINGLEVEVLVNGEWLEILECGEVNPVILRNAGIDPDEYSGLAMGMGLERLSMICKGIDDIRVLRSEDPRVREQLKNLDPYQPVSNQPSTKQDLSYTVSKDATEEDICEDIRDALSSVGQLSLLENITVSGEWPYEKLPAHVQERLGMNATQKNVAVRVLIRPLSGTLVMDEVNEWMDTVYHTIHKGTKGSGYR